MAAIPPKLEQEIVGKAGEGWTTRKIAAWLHEVHNVKTSHNTVANVLNRIQEERAPIAKAVVRRALEKSLHPGLAQLDTHRDQLAELAQDTYLAIKNDVHFMKRGSADEPISVEGRELFSKIVEQHRKLVDTQVHHSGADEPEENVFRPVIIIPPESND